MVSGQEFPDFLGIYFPRQMLLPKWQKTLKMDIVPFMGRLLQGEGRGTIVGLLTPQSFLIICSNINAFFSTSGKPLTQVPRFIF